MRWTPDNQQVVFHSGGIRAAGLDGTPSSRPGERSAGCATQAPSTPGCTGCSSTPVAIRSGKPAGARSSSPPCPVERPEPRDDDAQLADRDELEQGFLDRSVEHRAVLVLTHYVGLPAPEIARILRIPPETVASRLHYGAKAMGASMARAASVPSTAPEPGR